MENWSLDKYKSYKNKTNKYSNKKIIVDGIEFESKLEARRWQQLKLLQKAGNIKDLRRQIKFELQPSYIKNDKVIQSINYVADFVYYDLNKRQFIIEDTKGYKTEIYKLKKKILEYKYPDLEIKEIRKEDI